jgi:hypothetical protein
MNGFPCHGSSLIRAIPVTIYRRGFRISNFAYQDVRRNSP